MFEHMSNLKLSVNGNLSSRKFLLFFFLISIGLVFPNIELLGQDNESILEYPGLVPQDVALYIAANKAQEVWGTVSSGKIVLTYTLDGQPSAYIIPFKIGGGKFAPDHVILNELRKSRAELEEALKALKTIQNNLVIHSVERDSLFKGFEESSENNLVKRRKELFEKIKRGRKEVWGVGQYGYVAISALYDLIPIQEYSNTLPYYYTRLDFATEKAKKKIGRNAQLSRVFYSGPMDQLFEFSANNKQIWISPFHGTSFLPKTVKEVKRVLYLSNESKVQIRASWQTQLHRYSKRR